MARANLRVTVVTDARVRASQNPAGRSARTPDRCRAGGCVRDRCHVGHPARQLHGDGAVGGVPAAGARIPADDAPRRRPGSVGLGRVGLAFLSGVLPGERCQCAVAECARAGRVRAVSRRPDGADRSFGGCDRDGSGRDLRRHGRILLDQGDRTHPHRQFPGPVEVRHRPRGDDSHPVRADDGASVSACALARAGRYSAWPASASTSGRTRLSVCWLRRPCSLTASWVRESGVGGSSLGSSRSGWCSHT